MKMSACSREGMSGSLPVLLEKKLQTEYFQKEILSTYTVKYTLYLNTLSLNDYAATLSGMPAIQNSYVTVSLIHSERVL